MTQEIEPSIADVLKRMSKALREATEEEQEEQRRSFAFGNANSSNPDVTRSKIDDAAAEKQGMLATDDD